MFKMLRNRKGFTLVEVIVVAVIVLILAAVAIPLYNGYIADSRQNVCANVAGTVASAFGAAIQNGQNPVDGWINPNGTADAPGLVTIPATTTGGLPNMITIPRGIAITIVGNSVTASFVGTGIVSQPYRFNQ